MMSRHFSVEKPENHPPVDDQFGFVVHATPISVRFRARFT